MRIFKNPQFLQVSVAPRYWPQTCAEFSFSVADSEGPKKTISDRFSRSWALPSNLLAVLRGAKMGPKSLQSGLEDSSQRGKAHLQFHREFSGSWRLGGGPGRSKIGLKRVRSGVRVHPFRHASSWSTEKCSSRNWCQNRFQKWPKNGSKMGSKFGQKSLPRRLQKRGPSWARLGAVLGSFLDHCLSKKYKTWCVFISLCNEMIKTHHVFTFFVVRFSWIFWWKHKKLMSFEHFIFFDAFSWVLIHHKIIKTHHVLHISGLARLSLFLFFLFLTSMFFSVSHIIGVFLTSLFLSLLSGSCLCFLCLSWPAMGKHIQPKKTPPPKAHQKLQTQQHMGLLLMFSCTVSVPPPGAVWRGLYEWGRHDSIAYHSILFNG